MSRSINERRQKYDFNQKQRNEGVLFCLDVHKYAVIRNDHGVSCTCTVYIVIMLQVLKTVSINIFIQIKKNNKFNLQIIISFVQKHILNPYPHPTHFREEP